MQGVDCCRVRKPLERDEDQPKDHVNDGNASKQSRYTTLDVIENGQEPQVFIVREYAVDLAQVFP